MQSEQSAQEKLTETGLNKKYFANKKTLNLKYKSITVNNPEHKIVLKVSDIKFSQSSISDSFRDGTSLQDTIDLLLEQKIVPETIASIRVVKFRGMWITLDNRRLRVFKNAFIAEVPVIACDLKDPAVYREFHDKRSNKTLEGGGEIKPAVATLLSMKGRSIIFRNDNHFDEGAFIFTKKVLNWTFEQIEAPLASLKHTPTLPEFYDPDDRDAYYASFLDLILEEARAIIQAGIEAAVFIDPIPLKWIDAKPSKNPQNPSVFIFQKTQISSKADIKPGDILLLEEQSSKIKLLAMVGAPRNTSDQQENKIQLKVIIEDYLNKVLMTTSDQVEVWTAKPLGSLITQMRMYDACIQMPGVDFEEELFGGRGNILGYIKPYPFLKKLTEKTPRYKDLNDSQCEAVNKFLQLEQGIELVQGPPGTGKTTMIITLLNQLVLSNQRVLVCAPSNKAVQVLAERFVNAYSEVPVALAGVEDKLPDAPQLQAIFIHTWAERIKKQLAEIEQDLWRLLPLENTKPLTLQASINILASINEAFLQLYNACERYKFSFLSRLTGTKENFISNLEELFNGYAKGDFAVSDKGPVKPVRPLLSVLYTLVVKLENELQKCALDNTKQGLEAQLLDHSYIIFSTLSVAGRKSFKEMDPIDVLIVDEAGQSVEAETLIAFTMRPKKCMLIGDTKQLPATVISKSAEAKKFNRSLLYRLLEECKQPYTLLDVQYRMHPLISAWPAKRYYEGQIKNAASVVAESHMPLSLQSTPSFIAPYAFIDVPGQERTSSGHSFYNENEALVLDQLLGYLNKKHKIDIAKQVGIITFYKGQVDYLQKSLSKRYQNPKIQTVDSFQGSESDIILISFVRANNKGQVGFLKDFRRLNVAITRAKYSLIMLGDVKTLVVGNEDLASLIQNAAARECLFNLKQVQAVTTINEQIKPKSSSIKEQKKSQKISQRPFGHKAPACRFFTGKTNSCRKGQHCEFTHQPLSLAGSTKNRKT